MRNTNFTFAKYLILLTCNPRFLSLQNGVALTYLQCSAWWAYIGLTMLAVAVCDTVDVIVTLFCVIQRKLTTTANESVSNSTLTQRAIREGSVSSDSIKPVENRYAGARSFLFNASSRDESDKSSGDIGIKESPGLAGSSNDHKTDLSSSEQPLWTRNGLSASAEKLGLTCDTHHVEDKLENSLLLVGDPPEVGTDPDDTSAIEHCRSDVLESSSRDGFVAEEVVFRCDALSVTVRKCFQCDSLGIELHFAANSEPKGAVFHGATAHLDIKRFLNASVNDLLFREQQCCCFKGCFK
jgi:hypothetical protein